MKCVSNALKGKNLSKDMFLFYIILCFTFSSLDKWS